MPLRDFLDSIVIARPRYRWVEEDGVIDFVPTTGLPELLGARVSEFEANKVTRGEALDALKGSPEVKDIINRRGMDEFTLSLCCGLSNPNPPPPKRFSIKYKNATVKEILNAIAREHGQAVWFYMEWQDWPERGKRYYQLYIH